MTGQSPLLGITTWGRRFVEEYAKAYAEGYAKGLKANEGIVRRAARSVAKALWRRGRQ